MEAGLCGSCTWARLVGSARGSRFLRCGRSDDDARYARYPALPVRACPGYEPRRDAPPTGEETEEHRVRRSIDRIRTTHVGSLPRPPELLALLRDKNAGRPVDRSAFEAGVTAAVSEVVARQQAAGLDAINDGEQGRVDYTVYVADRLSGLTGESTPLAQPAPEFPEWEEMARSLIPQNLRHPACDGPLAWRDFAAVERDIRQLKSAAVAAGAEDELFITAVSPGQIARFLENQYYPDDDAYLEALAAVMQREYEAIAAAGVIVQLDCPDLAFGYQYGHAGRSLDEFRRVVARHVEVLNAATAKIPPERLRMHVCWSSTTGPHHRDIELREIAAEDRQGAAAGHRRCGGEPAPRTRMAGLARGPLARRQAPHPRRDRHDHQLHRASAGRGGPDRALRLRGGAGAGDRGWGLRLRHLRGPGAVDREIVWRKLASLVEGARLASERLWSLALRPGRIRGVPNAAGRRPVEDHGGGKPCRNTALAAACWQTCPRRSARCSPCAWSTGSAWARVAEQMQINPSLVRRIQQQGLLQIRRGLASA